MTCMIVLYLGGDTIYSATVETVMKDTFGTSHVARVVVLFQR